MFYTDVLDLLTRSTNPCRGSIEPHLLKRTTNWINAISLVWAPQRMLDRMLARACALVKILVNEEVENHATVIRTGREDRGELALPG